MNKMVRHFSLAYNSIWVPCTSETFRSFSYDRHLFHIFFISSTAIQTLSSFSVYHALLPVLETLSVCREVRYDATTLYNHIEKYVSMYYIWKNIFLFTPFYFLVPLNEESIEIVKQIDFPFLADVLIYQNNICF